MTRNNRIVSITFATPAATTEEAQERALTVHDLIETANFALSNGKPGPYALNFSVRDERLELSVNDTKAQLLHGFALSLKPFARIVRDYAQIRDSYMVAMTGSNPQAIEAIDMARRAIHNEGAELVISRLEGKVETDHATARRLFSLISELLPKAGQAAPAAVAKSQRPKLVLFVCNQNSIRSPMAAAITHHLYGHAIYAASAGITPGDPDPFVSVVMDEVGMDLKSHRPHSVHDDEELGFDLIVTLSPEAKAEAANLPKGKAAAMEHWLLPDPSTVQGSREQILDAYRALRVELTGKIKARFA